MDLPEDLGSLRKEEILEHHNRLTNDVNFYNNLQNSYKLIGNSGYGAL